MTQSRDGIMGLVVADALGVPVEFNDRERLERDPVVSMRSYGTYNQPAGTWSDDTSMTLCLIDSLTKKLDYQDIMKKFEKWINYGEYTPFGGAFDFGITTRQAITSFEEGIPPLECGGKSEYDNGNGSLMRILPILFYLESIYGKNFINNDDAFTIIHNVSALTHQHKRSQIACAIYISVAAQLLTKKNLSHSVRRGISQAMANYEKHPDFVSELAHFKRLTETDFQGTDVSLIKSSGYVIDTLEAAIWCLLNTNSYQACVLKAVNLGSDTDTVGAVVGGLAGIYYGYSNIPEEWLVLIQKRSWIEELCHLFDKTMVKNSRDKLIKYIPYFETVTKDSVATWISGGKADGKTKYMPYPKYDDTLVNFVNDVYKTKFMTTEYLKIIENRNLKGTKEMITAIDSADLELLSAILTGHIRQERFGDGLWIQAVEDKVFLKLLKRLQQLT